MKSGQFKGYSKDFRCEPFKVFRVLVVTTSEKRLENMRVALQTIDSSLSPLLRFFWLTSFGQVMDNMIFGQIWKSLDAADARLHEIG